MQTPRWRETDSNLRFPAAKEMNPLREAVTGATKVRLQAVAYLPGTNGSNPVPSSGESCKPPVPRRVLSLGGTARHQRFDERLPPQRADPEGRLAYAGRAGTGISHAELERLWRRL